MTTRGFGVVVALMLAAVLVPPPPDRRQMLRTHGTVDVVASPHATGGWQEARRERVAALPGAYCPDRMCVYGLKKSASHVDSGAGRSTSQQRQVSDRRDAMIATLIATLAEEDDAEDLGVLAPDDRLTCHVHGGWIHRCVSSPVHVNPVTRHRWCRGCDAELGVVVDELTGEVAMRCPRCGRGGSAATARLIAACRASIEARQAT